MSCICASASFAEMILPNVFIISLYGCYYLKISRRTLSMWESFQIWEEMEIRVNHMTWKSVPTFRFPTQKLFFNSVHRFLFRLQSASSSCKLFHPAEPNSYKNIILIARKKSIKFFLPQYYFGFFQAIQCHSSRYKINFIPLQIVQILLFWN